MTSPTLPARILDPANIRRWTDSPRSDGGTWPPNRTTTRVTSTAEATAVREPALGGTPTLWRQ